MPLKVELLHIYINCLMYLHLRKMILNLDAACLLSVSIDHHTWIESCEKKKQQLLL